MERPIACGNCGALLDVAVLKRKATQDILRANKPHRSQGPQQYSADCPNCGEKRVYVERRDKSPAAPETPGDKAPAASR